MNYDIFSRCQRNWLDEPIPQDDYEKIISALEKTPTKQSLDYYRIFVSQDQEWNKSMIPLAERFSLDEDTRSWTKEFKYKQTYRNAQIGAPLLILFIQNRNKSFDEGAVEMAIGFAAGAVKTIANQLGYATGYCACFGKKFSKKLGGEVRLGIGIGKPNHNLAYNEIQGPKGNFIIETKPTVHNITVKE